MMSIMILIVCTNIDRHDCKTVVRTGPIPYTLCMATVMQDAAKYIGDNGGVLAEMVCADPKKLDVYLGRSST